LRFFVECWISKGKNQTVGVARQQRHFLCGDKENEAKENFGAALGMSGSLSRQHQFGDDCR